MKSQIILSFAITVLMISLFSCLGNETESSENKDKVEHSLNHKEMREKLLNTGIDSNYVLSLENEELEKAYELWKDLGDDFGDKQEEDNQQEFVDWATDKKDE